MVTWFRSSRSLTNKVGCFLDVGFVASGMWVVELLGCCSGFARGKDFCVESFCSTLGDTACWKMSARRSSACCSVSCKGLMGLEGCGAFNA